MSHVVEDEVARLQQALDEASGRAAAREREVLALRRVALAMNSSLELDKLLETLVQVAVELTGARRAYVVWRDEDELERLLASRPGGAWRLPEDAVRRVEAVREALDSGELRESGPMVCLPLIAPGRTLGVLCVDELPTSQEAIADLHVLAAHAAVALENALLFAALRRRSTELEAALARFHAAEHDAHTDPLTGVANKRQFQEQGRREAAAAKRYGRPFSLIIADIDHFKAINDTHGHLVGDEVLKGVSGTMARHVRGADLLARWGGEEFVVLCPMTTRHEAANLAERLRRAVEAWEATGEDGRPLPRAQISLGVATYAGSEDALEAVLERADRALLGAKEGGRNRVRVEA